LVLWLGTDLFDMSIRLFLIGYIGPLIVETILLVFHDQLFNWNLLFLRALPLPFFSIYLAARMPSLLELSKGLD